MRYRKTAVIISALVICVVLLGFSVSKQAANEIPKLWDLKKLKSAHLPLVDRSIDVEPISEDLYYKIPERIAG